MRSLTATIASLMLTFLLVQAGPAEQGGQRAPSSAPPPRSVRPESVYSRSTSQSSASSSSRRSRAGLSGSHSIGRLRPEKVAREVTDGFVHGAKKATRLVGGGFVGSQGKLQRAKSYAEQGRYVSSVNEVGTAAGKAALGLAGACVATASAGAAVVGGLSKVVQHGCKAVADSIDDLINHENTYQARPGHHSQTGYRSHVSSRHPQLSPNQHAESSHRPRPRNH